MKVLVAITSCAKDVNNGSNKVIRDTWVKRLGLLKDFEYRFFIGIGTPKPLYLEHPHFQHSYNDLLNQNPLLTQPTPLNYSLLEGDEILLNTPDSYPYLPYKIREIRRWAMLMGGYDYIYKCDTDTIVVPTRLRDSGFQLHDYIGFGPELVGPELQLLTKAGLPGVHYAWGGAGYWLSKKAYSHTTMDDIDIMFEDVWTGYHLATHGIPLHLDDRYCYNLNSLDKAISIHLDNDTSRRMKETSILLDKCRLLKPVATLKRPKRFKHKLGLWKK